METYQWKLVIRPGYTNAIMWTKFHLRVELTKPILLLYFLVVTRIQERTFQKIFFLLQDYNKCLMMANDFKIMMTVL